MRQVGERASQRCFINHVITWVIAAESWGTPGNSVEPRPLSYLTRGERDPGIYKTTTVSYWLRVAGGRWHQRGHSMAFPACCTCV